MSILRHLPYAILSAGLLAAGGASAQSIWSIDQREANQQERIDQARRNGSLTREEYNRLERGQDRIDNYERRARADGVVTSNERQRLDSMLDREGRQIYRESHDNQRADRRGWGDRDGWGHNGGHDGWNRDGWNNGRHEGWTRGEHNGWDGNRPPGVERRDARLENRIDNGRHDGSLTNGEANRLQHEQNRIDRYESHARSDGNVTPYERNRINNMQNREGRDIYNARHNDRTSPPAPTTGTQQPGGSRNWGGGWQHQPTAGNQQPTGTPPAGMQPGGGQRNGGGWQRPQGGATMPATAPNNGGWGMRPASAPAPTAPNNGGWGMRQASAPAPAAPTMTRSAPSGGGGRHR
ncbi:MAG: hypothetical protein U1E60_19105 [Reyranellaceae bacterium]